MQEETQRKGLQIFVKPIPQGDKITLVVDENDTVKDVKFKTGFSLTLPLQLLFEGKELDNSKKLLEYGVKEGDTLQLKKDFILQIFVEVSYEGREGSTMKTIIARSSDTVWYVKAQVGYEESMWVPKLLSETGDELVNEATLWDCGVKQNATLQLVLNKIAPAEELVSPDSIPCDRCHKYFPFEAYATHELVCQGVGSTSSVSTTSSPTSSRPKENVSSDVGGAAGDSAELIPCEFCGQLFPFETYLDHTERCGRG